MNADLMSSNSPPELNPKAKTLADKNADTFFSTVKTNTAKLYILFYTSA